MGSLELHQSHVSGGLKGPALSLQQSREQPSSSREQHPSVEKTVGHRVQREPKPSSGSSVPRLPAQVPGTPWKWSGFAGYFTLYAS